MTKEQLISAVIEVYKNARAVTLPEGMICSEKLRRGRNHTVSGRLEDLFGHYLLEHFDAIDKITIDQPMSIVNSDGKTRKIIYPDLAIMQNNQVKLIIDMKTDLGRKREELENILITASDKIAALKGTTLRYKDGITKAPFIVRPHKNIQCFIVIVSKQNINSKVLEKHLKNIKANEKISKTKVYFLTDGVHPNRSIYKENEGGVNILPDFDLFLADTQKLLV